MSSILKSRLPKNKTLWLVAALAIPFTGLVALMITAGSGQVTAPPAQPKLHPVNATPLQLQSSYQQQRLAYGRVEPGQQIQAGFELAGTLQNITVDEGDTFEQGQVLARLDTQRLDARMRAWDAALRRAEADDRLARRSEQRVIDLVKRKLDSPQRLDEVREAAIASQAQVIEVKANQELEAIQLDKSVLRAPFAGSVLARPADPGTVVAAGQTVLTLQQASGLEARIALSADDAFHMQVGQRHTLQHDGKAIAATIKSIARQRTLNTRTVDVIFTIEAQQADLLPGDLLALSYSKEVTEAGLWVPRQALNSGVRGLWTVFTVSGDGDQQIVTRVVEVLHIEQDRAYVRGALVEGDWLVVNGTQRLVPGQQVRVSLATDPTVASGH